MNPECNTSRKIQTVFNPEEKASGRMHTVVNQEEPSSRKIQTVFIIDAHLIENSRQYLIQKRAGTEKGFIQK